MQQGEGADAAKLLATPRPNVRINNGTRIRSHLLIGIGGADSGRRWLDDVIERVGLRALEGLNAVAELGEGDRFEDFHDGISNFLHDAADATSVFVGAGAFFVETLADAAHGCEWALDEPDDLCQGHAVGGSPETVTAGNAAFAFENSGGLEVVENLFEEPFGDVLARGDFLDAQDGIVVRKMKAQSHKGPQRILSAKGQFHYRKPIISTDIVKIMLAVNNLTVANCKHNY